MTRQGWHGERQAHGLCAKGIRVRPPKMSASGRGVPVGDSVFSDDEWVSLRDAGIVSLAWFSKPFDFSGFRDMLPDNVVFDVGNTDDGTVMFLFDRDTHAVLSGVWSIRSKRYGQDVFVVYDVHAYPKGTGFGSLFMDAVKRYADDHDMKVEVSEVANPKFFERFDWLEPDRSGLFYAYDGQE